MARRYDLRPNCSQLVHIEFKSGSTYVKQSKASTFGRIVTKILKYLKETKIKSVKTSFKYCSNGSGQNSVIPVVWGVPE